MNDKTKDKSSGNEKYIISAPIVISSVNDPTKDGTSQKEFYLERSIQNYFIKFCESNITKTDLEEHVSKLTGFMKVVTVEIEYRNGNWDICDKKDLYKGRTGEYVIVHRII